MSEGTLRVLAYLDHILQAVQRIARYTKGMTEEGFSASEMAQDAVIRNIEIIGEAARNIARHHPDFAGSHPEIPWESIYLMRNRVRTDIFRSTSRLSGEPCSATSPNLNGKFFSSK